VFVKICGMTSIAAVEAAAAAGADAVGFVFANSPRQVSPAQALELSQPLPTSILRVAVMRHPSATQVREVLEIFRPDWMQTDAADFDELRLPAGCQALPVYRNGAVPTRTDQPSRILFEGADSGTGLTADWDEARTLASSSELILAGGLNSANVAKAIAAVGPWGVDVSSGVEVERGRKDPALIAEFIAAVKATENAS
jgi:phosphoribosylanthranilate isomerase